MLKEKVARKQRKKPKKKSLAKQDLNNQELTKKEVLQHYNLDGAINFLAVFQGIAFLIGFVVVCVCALVYILLMKEIDYSLIFSLVVSMLFLSILALFLVFLQNGKIRKFKKWYKKASNPSNLALPKPKTAFKSGLNLFFKPFLLFASLAVWIFILYVYLQHFSFLEVVIWKNSRFNLTWLDVCIFCALFVSWIYLIVVLIGVFSRKLEIENENEDNKNKRKDANKKGKKRNKGNSIQIRNQ